MGTTISSQSEKRRHRDAVDNSRPHIFTTIAWYISRETPDSLKLLLAAVDFDHHNGVFARTKVTTPLARHHSESWSLVDCFFFVRSEFQLRLEFSVFMICSLVETIKNIYLTSSHSKSYSFSRYEKSELRSEREYIVDIIIVSVSSCCRLFFS